MSVPTPAELLQRAQDLGPALVERVPEGRALRRLPDANVADMQAAGFFQILQPQRFGGFEHDPLTFFDVQAEVARHCPSTAWVLGVVAVHNWQLALFDDRAQQDVWGEDPRTLVSSSYMPVGKVTRVEGGFRLSGRWSFSSGSDHCKWAFLGAFVPVDSGPPDMRTFLVPRADYTLEDTWHVAGLAATGSKDVVVEDVFVPEHRTHKIADGFRRKSPGNEVNPAPLYRIPFGQIFVRSVSTSCIGIAQGALDAYLDVARKRVAQSDGSKVSEDVASQTVCARAQYAIDECRLVLRDHMGTMQRWAHDGADMPIGERVRFRYASSMVAEKCIEAVDALFTQSGGRAIFHDASIQRFFQDVHAARAHYANNPEKPGRNLGGVMLGARTKDFFL